MHWLLRLSGTIVLAAFLYMLAGVFFPRNAKYSKWSRQAASLGQLGVVLQAYKEANNNTTPAHVFSLKTWAIEQKEFKDMARSQIWMFEDPKSGLMYDWILCSPTNDMFLAYAPRSTAEIGDPNVPLRLVLTAVNKG